MLFSTTSPTSRPSPLLTINDLGMRKLPQNAAEGLLELVMRPYENASTLIASNRPVEDWGKLLGDTAAVAALLATGCCINAQRAHLWPTKLAHASPQRPERLS